MAGSSRQLTLVSHWGPKPPDFADLLRFLQDGLARRLGTAFRPRPLEQVHATVLGLEGCRRGEEIRSIRSGSPVNLRGLLERLRSPGLPPIQLRLGGYRSEDSYPFRSRGLHPYLRSFSIQGDAAVAVGWPLEGQRFPGSLARLRKELERSGARHKWHAGREEADDDFFLVVGAVDHSRIDPSHAEAAAEELRSTLASGPGTLLTLGLTDLRIVAYLDPELPVETSLAFRLDEPDLVSKLRSLYPECPPGESGTREGPARA